VLYYDSLFSKLLEDSHVEFTAVPPAKALGRMGGRHEGR
jgi:hypothetical protein